MSSARQESTWNMILNSLRGEENVPQAEETSHQNKTGKMKNQPENKSLTHASCGMHVQTDSNKRIQLVRGCMVTSIEMKR